MRQQTKLKPGTIQVITGPPCGGKSTWVQDNSTPHDLVIDLDKIAAALGYPADHVCFDDDHPAIHAARMSRASLIRWALDARFVQSSSTVWIIDSAPTDEYRIRYLKAGATITPIDPGIEVCLERAQARGGSAPDQVRGWYALHEVSTDQPGALGVFG